MKTLIAALALFALPAFAGGKVKEACGADAEKLCPGLAPHKGLHKCLNEHAAQVSPACADALAQAKQKHHDAPPPPPPPAQ